MTKEANMVQHQPGGQFLQIGSGGTLNVHTYGTFSVAGTTVNASAAELNILDDVTATSGELNILDGMAASAEAFTPVPATTAATKRISFVLQLVDADGTDIATAQFVKAYLASDLAGVTLVTTAPSSLGIGTCGGLIPYAPAATSPVFGLVSATTGSIRFNMRYAAAMTAYLGVIMPSGAIQMATTAAIWT